MKNDMLDLSLVALEDIEAPLEAEDFLLGVAIGIAIGVAIT